MNLHIEHATIHLSLPDGLTPGLGDLMTTEIVSPAVAMPGEQPPDHGAYWAGQGGHYICTLPALLGAPARHVIAAAAEAEDLAWGPTEDMAGATSHIDGPAKRPAGLFQYQPEDGIGAAQRLEAAEAEAKALVLDMQCTEAEFSGQRRQRMQRRYQVIVAMSEKTLDRVGAGNAQGFGIGRIERLAVQCVVIEQEHWLPPWRLARTYCRTGAKSAVIRPSKCKFVSSG